MSIGGRGMGGGFERGGDAQDPLRLVEGTGDDLPLAQAWAVDLLRRTPPHRTPVGRKQRVRMGLAQVHRRRGALVLRPAIAIAVLIGLGAVASAALGRWPTLVSDAYRRLMGAPAPVASDPPRAIPARSARASGSRPPIPVRSPAPDDAAPAAAAAAAGLAEAPPVVVQLSSPPAPRRAVRRALSESVRGLAPGAAREAARARHLAAPPTGDDTAPVIQAMRALRVEGNPVRARALLDRYLARYPEGTLAEEALAMSIEAANVHHDGDAGALARRYLKLYPAGHFSALARQTLNGGSAPSGN